MVIDIDVSKLNYKMMDYFKSVPREDWDSFQWQMRNRIRTAEEIEKWVSLSESEKMAFEAFLNDDGCLNEIAISPHYFALIDPKDPKDPIRMESFPLKDEMVSREVDMEDALAEDVHTVAPGLVHRYPDRCVLLVTPMCATYCRFCTRNRMVAKLDNEGYAFATDLKPALKYLREHTEVRDVLVTGGDPFTLQTEELGNILKELRSIPNIEFVRIGTRIPVTLPQRVDQKMIDMLKIYKPWLNLHFNHPNEILNVYSQRCVNMLADAGLPLGNQMVLLRGINDDPKIVKTLNHELLKQRVKPYYIFQCHLQKRLGHFRTRIGSGVEIIENLRGWTTGYAVPQFIVDLPGGGGKVSVMPNYVLSYDKDVGMKARNYLNKPTFVYYEENREEDKVPKYDLERVLGLKPADFSKKPIEDSPGVL